MILADEALQVVALGKILHVTRTDRPAEYLNVELNGAGRRRLWARDEVRMSHEPTDEI